MSLPTGTRLGPYEISALLGIGGMGEVYRARDTRLGRQVALKVLPGDSVQDRQALDRFQREAQAIAALSHPNIVSVHEFDSDAGISYIITELLEGETLRGRLSRSALSWRKAVEIGAAIADGLAAAHDKGIIHRDLKPENIFLTADGQVKILDFGLAHVLLASDETQQTAIRYTTPGMVMGTIGYMSPEQVRGEPVDTATDVFSLGSILYEMLSGVGPFSRATAAETMAAILNEEPPEVANIREGIPPDLTRLVRHAMEKNRRERFQSARDLAFDLRTLLTPREHPVVPADSGRHRVAPLAAGAAVGAVFLAAILLVSQRPASDIEAVPTIKSLAVLPLDNLAPDPAEEYFADGMTEALIADLARIGSLRVISRTSIMRYKGVRKPIAEVGRELGVDGIIEGSVLRSGDRVRITAQLIHAPTDRHLWAQSYERSLQDVLALQSEVARAVAHEVRATLTPADDARLSESRQVAPAAYEAYLKGRYHWNKRTPEGLSKSVEYFNQSVEKDSTYALAHVGLADAYVSMGWYGVLPPADGATRARAAAQRAIDLAPSLGEPYATLAHIAANFDWDSARADREFRKAIELNPNYASAHHWYSLYLAREGRFEEAIREAKLAQQLDPLSLIISENIGDVYLYAREFDKAIEQELKTLEMDPNFPIARQTLIRAYEAKGMYREALDELAKDPASVDVTPEMVSQMRKAFAAAGWKGVLRKRLEILQERARTGYVSPVMLATLYAQLGHSDEAFRWLERGYAERSSTMRTLKTSPRWDPIRSDPRFAEMLRRVGF